MNRRDALRVLTALPALTTVARADVKPTTVIVAEVVGRLTCEHREALRTQLAAVWPHNRIVICDDVLDEER